MQRHYLKSNSEQHSGKEQPDYRRTGRIVLYGDYSTITNNTISKVLNVELVQQEGTQSSLETG